MTILHYMVSMGLHKTVWIPAHKYSIEIRILYWLIGEIPIYFFYKTKRRMEAPSAFSFSGKLLDDVESQIFDGFCQCVAVQPVALYND